MVGVCKFKIEERKVGRFMGMGIRFGGMCVVIVRLTYKRMVVGMGSWGV